MSHWDVDAAKAALDTELMVSHDGEDSATSTHAEIAKRKLTESCALVADRLIHMALYSESENMAYKAGTYILDRVMGRISDAGFASSDDDELTKLVKRVYSQS